jgi:molybdopterin/thiamine biosynthesis adenylyltransferase
MDVSWYNRRNDRQIRYAGRVLPHDRPVVISIDPDNAVTFDGQVTMIVAANLLSRMTPALVLDLPDARIVSALPWAGSELGDFILRVARGADPHAEFKTRKPKAGDYVLAVGPGTAPAAVHGSGWYAFVGPGHSPIMPAGVTNPFGPAFAAVAAVARLFALELAPLDGPFLFDTYRWKQAFGDTHHPYPVNLDPGTIWGIGAGSVGTAALYFLTLATRRFSSAVFDMDVVKVENLDRSPIFTADDAERSVPKANAAVAYLHSVGVADATAECDPLDQSSRWLQRTAGEPDLVISAANERNVRYLIEQSCPPMQIYGTTGKNWGASVLRHIPLRDACSCCVFPPDAQQAPLQCAEGKVIEPESGQEVDAALPFLSFAAGLMTAAEVVKAQLPGYPFSPNRTVFSAGALTTPRFASFSSPFQDRCVCQDRSLSVQNAMIAGTRYARLSST